MMYIIFRGANNNRASLSRSLKSIRIILHGRTVQTGTLG